MAEDVEEACGRESWLPQELLALFRAMDNQSELQTMSHKQWLVLAKPHYAGQLTVVCEEERSWGTGWLPTKPHPPSMAWSKANRFAGVPDSMEGWPQPVPGKKVPPPPQFRKYKEIIAECVKATAHWERFWNINKVS